MGKVINFYTRAVQRSAARTDERLLNRRWAQRRPLNLSVVLHVGQYPSHHVVHCTTKNVSLTGMRLEAPNIPDNKHVFVALAISTTDCTPVIYSKVVRQLNQGFAITFQHMDVPVMHKLRSLLTRGMT